MALELVLRSNSSFLRKESICVVTRRTLVGHHHGDNRLALVPRAADRLEPDPRRRPLAVVVADVPGEREDAAAFLPGGGTL